MHTLLTMTTATPGHHTFNRNRPATSALEGEEVVPPQVPTARALAIRTNRARAPAQATAALKAPVGGEAMAVSAKCCFTATALKLPSNKHIQVRPTSTANRPTQAGHPRVSTQCRTTRVFRTALLRVDAGPNNSATMVLYVPAAPHRHSSSSSSSRRSRRSSPSLHRLSTRTLPRRSHRRALRPLRRWAFPRSRPRATV
jgi:hypothetical protein